MPYEPHDQRRKLTAWLDEYLATHKCVDCGKRWPHQCVRLMPINTNGRGRGRMGEAKARSPRRLAHDGVSRDRLLAAVARCEVVCLPCIGRREDGAGPLRRIVYGRGGEARRS